MKSGLACSLLLILFYTNSYSQRIDVVSTRAAFNKSAYPALMMDIPGVTKAVVEKQWKAYLKDSGGKVKSIKGGYFCNNGKIPSVSYDTLDMYARIEDSGKNNVRLIFAVNKNGSFIDMGMSSEYQALVNIMQDFAADIRKSEYDKTLGKETKILIGLKKDLDKSTSKRENLLKDNEKMQEKIKENQREIKDLEKTEKEQQEKVEEQQKVIDKLDLLKKSVE